MSSNFQHFSKFTKNGKLFADLNENGVLKIWDTETNELKQEYTPNLHLSGPCTCLIWLTVHKKTKKNPKSIQSETIESFYLALGTSNGNVVLYSYALGQVERSFKGEGHSGKVTNLIYNHDDLIYTCGEDCQIIVWSISNEKSIESWSIGNDKPYSLIYLPETKRILIGARQLKLFDIERHEIIQSFTGHNNDIALLSEFIIDDIEYVISGAKLDRMLCIWKIDGSGKKKNIQNAIGTLLMEDIAICLSSKIDYNGDLKVTAVTRSGVIHIYSMNMTKIHSEKPIKPKVTIKIVSDNSENIESVAAVTASLDYSNPRSEIRFGFGDNQFMIFEEITPNYDENIQILIRNNPRKIMSKNNKMQTEKTLKTVIPIINKNDIDYQSSGTLKKKQKSLQMPMETRLQNLHLTNGEIPQAQSKVQLLMQSLHSRDASMLHAVLFTDDPKVIQLTLQKLPVQYVGCLVNELTLLMEKKRVNVQVAASWLKVLIQTHSSQLMAMGSNELFNKFGPCIGIIEHRSNCLKELSKLNGRLQLLINQIKRNNEEDNLNNENALLYEDQDSSNSEIDMKNDDTDSEEDSDADGDEEAEENNAESDRDTDDEMDIEMEN